MTSAQTTAERSQRDRELYDRTASHLARKDRDPACRAARLHRHLQSLRHASVSRLGTVLEVGCGCGFGAEYLSPYYDKYIGIDHSASVIEIARGINGTDRAKFEVADATKFDAAEVDTIFMIGLLHHLPNPVEALRNLVQTANHGAIVIANEPQASNPIISLARRIRAKKDTNYSDEQDEYTPSQFREILEGAGLSNIRMKPQGLFSTPFAEVMMPFKPLAGVATRFACAFDSGMEAMLGNALRPVSWNLVGIGTKQD